MKKQFLFHIMLGMIVGAVLLFACDNSINQRAALRQTRRFVDSGEYSFFIREGDLIHAAHYTGGKMKCFVYTSSQFDNEDIDTTKALTDDLLAENQAEESERMMRFLSVLKELFRQDVNHGEIYEDEYCVFYHPIFNYSELSLNEYEALDVYVALTKNREVLNVTMKIYDGGALESIFMLKSNAKHFLSPLLSPST